MRASVSPRQSSSSAILFVIFFEASLSGARFAVMSGSWQAHDMLSRMDGWRADPGEDGLRRALATIVPDLASLPLRINPRPRQPNPLYWSGSAWIDERFVVKYAWSDIRAERLQREHRLLARLRAGPTPLPVPEVVASSEEPALFVTTAVRGEPLTWELASQLGPGQLTTVATQLAGFLTRLHGLAVA